MHFAQIYTSGLAHCSYLLGSGQSCVVVDPARDIEPYLERAHSFGMEITAVLETHLHADFVSGHLELAEATGADIYAPRAADCEFPHIAVGDGEEFAIGNLKFELLSTPGHTPEGAVYLASDLDGVESRCFSFPAIPCWWGMWGVRIFFRSARRS